MLHVPTIPLPLIISSSNNLLVKLVAPGSEITPCNKICKPLVVYRFSGNVMTSITTLRYNDKIITFLRQKSDFKVFKCHMINRI